MSVHVEVAAPGGGVGGSGPSLGHALIAMARDCGKRAGEFESSARTLREAETYYQRVATVIMTLPPEVGGERNDNHKNDNDEGEEDDGRPDDDFEVGEKG